MRRIGGVLFLLLTMSSFSCEKKGTIETVPGAPSTIATEAPASTTSSSTTTTTLATTLTSSSTTVARVSTTASATAIPSARATTTSTTTTPPAPAASSGACDPNYAGACVPIDSDVDCAGGGGNGPSYVYAKNFRVVGKDIYGLDTDHDGIACES